jgi:MFS family permease
MDKRGPRFVIELGVILLTAGLLAATTIRTPWQLYLYLGVLVGGGANCMTYTVQSQYLPNWFVRWRALAIGIAFSGVGVGALVALPWIQALILSDGWRTACWALGIVVLVVLVPINLLVAKRPEDMGLQPDGGVRASGVTRRSNIVDAEWAAVEWTVARAVRTARFWWIALAYFCGGFVWYAVQVHQTKYLVDVGFSPMQAAWALGLVAMAGIPGQILLGALSDRIGREIVWAITCAGFAICYAALLGLADGPSQVLLYVMVLSQGLLGYAVTSLMGPVVAEIFEGPHFGSIFGLVTVPLIAGGAAGPALAGLLYDRTGDYAAAFWLCIVLSAVGAAAIWRASPGKVRAVAGRATR